MADVNYYSTRLLMNMEGVNNGTVFTDFSLLKKSWAVMGAAKTSNTASKFGNTSLYLNGSSWIEASAGAESLFGLQDFTIEFWIKTTSATACIMDTLLAYLGWAIEVKSSCISFYSGIRDTRVIFTPGIYIDDNVWHHIAFCREDLTLRCFRDGILVASASDPSNYNASAPKLGLGAFANRDLPQYNLNGYLDDIRILVGVARYTASFTPPGPLDILPLPIRPSVVQPPFALVQTGSPALTFRSVARPIKLSDDIFGGKGRIAGTTHVKGTPNIAVRRRVRLLRERDSMMIRETWSDPVTGAYSFDNIDQNYQYTVISFDHDHNHRAVIADNLTPELMP